MRPSLRICLMDTDPNISTAFVIKNYTALHNNNNNMYIVYAEKLEFSGLANILILL